MKEEEQQEVKPDFEFSGVPSGTSTTKPVWFWRANGFNN